jgi:hypothetical protein
MELIKKHVDTIVILGGILGSILWMNGKFNSLERDIVIIKTVMIMKGIMPSELAAKGEEK